MAQGHEDEIFEDERLTIIRLQIEPFMFRGSDGADGLEQEDSFSTGQGSTSHNDEEEEMTDVNLERIGNTEWYVDFTYTFALCYVFECGRSDFCLFCHVLTID